MTEALRACGARVVASYVLAGGILSGKYATGASGRMAGEVDAPQLRRARAGGAASSRRSPPRSARRRRRWRWPSSSRNPLVATILFGATTPQQIRENVAAADVVAALTESQLERLRAIGV